MDPTEIREHKAFELPWYYFLELAPGLFTPGRDRWSVAQTRELLRHVDVESGGVDGGGARCLDLGIQEALVTILLERRGGSEILAYDRILRKSRLDLVKRALDTRFDLIGGMSLQDLPEALKQAGRDPFDLVVFSGVLYHMFDPLGGLAVVRGFVREGGICVIETAVAFEDSYTMHFNTAGRFTPHALWFVTPRCLDYLLRFLHLQPVDAVYLTGKREPEPKAGAGRLAAIRRAVSSPKRETAKAERQPAQGRIAVACRAVSGPVRDPDDDWIVGKDYKVDFEEFLDWEAVASNAPPVGYDDSREGLVRREDGSVDLHATVTATNPVLRNPEQARLTLEARY